MAKNAQFSIGMIRSSSLKFDIVSSGAAIHPSVKLIVDVLRSFVHGTDLVRVELAIDEAIRNAFEHGNLGITAEEKTELCEADSWDEEVARREKEAQESNKLIHVTADISSEKFVCSIRDEGEGFDWRKPYSALDVTDGEPALHGRGLTLLKKVFDTVEFSEKGEEVIVTKNFDPPTF